MLYAASKGMPVYWPCWGTPTPRTRAPPRQRRPCARFPDAPRGTAVAGEPLAARTAPRAPLNANGGSRRRSPPKARARPGCSLGWRCDPRLTQQCTDPARETHGPEQSNRRARGALRDTLGTPAEAGLAAPRRMHGPEHINGPEKLSEVSSPGRAHQPRRASRRRGECTGQRG